MAHCRLVTLPVLALRPLLVFLGASGTMRLAQTCRSLLACVRAENSVWKAHYYAVYQPDGGKEAELLYIHLIIWAYPTCQQRRCRIPLGATQTVSGGERLGHGYVHVSDTRCSGPFVFAHTLQHNIQRYVVWDLRDEPGDAGDLYPRAVFRRENTLLAGSYFVQLVPNDPSTNGISVEQTAVVCDLRMVSRLAPIVCAADVPDVPGIARYPWRNKPVPLMAYKYAPEMTDGAYLYAVGGQQASANSSTVSIVRLDGAGAVTDWGTPIHVKLPGGASALSRVLGGRSDRAVVSFLKPPQPHNPQQFSLGCVAPHTGRLLWYTDLACCRSATVVPMRNRVAAFTYESELFIFSFTHGELLHRLPLCTLAHEMPTGVQHLLGSLVVAHRGVFFLGGNEEVTRTAIIVDIESGQILWHLDAPPSGPGGLITSPCSLLRASWYIRLSKGALAITDMAQGLY
ncbi:hypothetical protein THASP1DRAFT_31329 [Thamnocephalis sphaerospora]|uniref:F-box domain-containing protein n=1 Tax=Thamnocephalis sphaerospora TaxID=78915 RepID=A0A4P9XLU3_9FUNG|nr:hypothetical protein THASP1DRAFT_31329 [Thamnocephalis sphaerospora]|eukprot:RKP06853.1 hypothetical protein THASP1DRAFT_31329 [Thamnocephalis sphaerospora]